MPAYLLDSDIIIDVLNNKHGRSAILRKLLEQGQLLACCEVSVAEVYAGLQPTEEARTEELLQSLEYYAVTWGIARRAGLLKRDWARKGVTLSIADILIAAVALEYNLTLITANLKHYPMSDLQLYPLAKRV